MKAMLHWIVGMLTRVAMKFDGVAEASTEYDVDVVTVTQFCLSEGVSQPSFYNWRKELREFPSDAKPKPKPSTTAVQFMPLRLATASPVG